MYPREGHQTVVVCRGSASVEAEILPSLALLTPERKKTGIYTLGASNLEVAYNLLLTRR